jgi:hypothetical protein
VQAGAFDDAGFLHFLHADVNGSGRNAQRFGDVRVGGTGVVQQRQKDLTVHVVQRRQREVLLAHAFFKKGKLTTSAASGWLRTSTKILLPGVLLETGT